MPAQSIMIIDDNDDDRYLLKRLIKKAGLNSQIFEAENGQVAFDFFSDEKKQLEKYPETYPPQIIFLDINMPIMGGFEFLEKFNKLKRERDNLNTVVFAMFTSSERKEDVEKATSYDFVQGFVTKGKLSIESLREIIREKFADIVFEGE